MPEKVIHEIRLNQYSAVPADRTRRFSLGTKDSYGVEQLRIVPGEGWDGLTITATFHPPEGEAVQVLVPADGLIDVPPEATRSGSKLPIKYGKIVFAGVADGVQRISCNLPYTVMDHAPVDGAASSGPSPSWYEQAAAHFVPSGGKSGQVLAKASDADLDVEWADGGNGTADHAKLSNRDASDQHPISAITGLETALKGKQPAGDYLTADTLQAATDAALAQAKATGEFDGKQGPKGDTGLRGEKGDTGPQGPAGAVGKSAYQYAQDGGYTGTEAEFAAKLAQEMPDKLPNPNTLTFTGAVSATYDGSEPVTVEIPSGGGGLSDYELIDTLDWSTEELAQFGAGKEYSFEEIQDILLVYTGVANNTTIVSGLFVTVNNIRLSAAAEPVSGKSGTPLNGYVFLRAIPGIGLFSLKSPGATSNTNYVPTNANIPYNLYPVTGKITQFKINNRTQLYCTNTGILKIYVR